ncbi:hybrid signal transduction histidine kinase M [Tanacetum coccineum]
MTVSDSPTPITTLSDKLSLVTKFLHDDSNATGTSIATLLTPKDVKDNKRSRTFALKAELQSIKLGTLSMEAYFQKIESLVIVLTSLGSIVNEEDVTVRSLLITKDMRLKSKEPTLLVDSSSPMVLMAQTGNTRHPLNTQDKSWKLCFNFAKGSYHFGSECRYVHDVNAKPNPSYTPRMSNNNTTYEMLSKILDKLGIHNIMGTVATS